MITSLSWIPRGAARQRPIRYELTPEEYQRVRSLAKQETEDQNGAAARHRSDVAIEEDDSDVDISDLPDALHMEDYDDEDDGGLVQDNDDDDLFDFQQQGNNVILDEGDSDEEDAEDNEVRPTDALLAVAITEDEYSHLEIQLLSDDGNLYVHHDIALPDFPLCLAWTDCPPFLAADHSQVTIGNFMAVGTFNPVIEIWNLDVLDPLEPTASLGAKATGKKKKKSGEQAYTPESHSDSVMGLSWNRHFRQAMASCSADTTVKIWDVTTQTCSHTFTHHTDKVQSVLWNEQTPTVLASGSFDKTVALMDCRSGDVTPCVARLSSDIESLAWDPFQEHHLYASLENGEVACIDIRMGTKSGGKAAAVRGLLAVFPAHEETTTAITFSAQVRGLCATSSVDKTVKIWDTEPVHRGKEPVLVAYKSMSVGQLFACQFFRDEPFMLGAGGDAGMLAIWDSDEQQGIKDYFSSRVELKPSDYQGVTQQQGGGEGGEDEDEDVQMTTEVAGGALLMGLSAAGDRRRAEAAGREEALLRELSSSVATSSSSASKDKDKDTKQVKKKKSKVKKTN